MKIIRGNDIHGSGAWQAPRGDRKHNGVDIICSIFQAICSDVDGKVTKVGYPYNPNDDKKGHLRYVEVTDSQKARVRYFYISPTVKKGDLIEKGDQLGTSQSLCGIYPKITQHYHLEVIAYVEPLEYIGE